jgi:hypothetical protein
MHVFSQKNGFGHVYNTSDVAVESMQGSANSLQGTFGADVISFDGIRSNSSAPNVTII